MIKCSLKQDIEIIMNLCKSASIFPRKDHYNPTRKRRTMKEYTIVAKRTPRAAFNQSNLIKRKKQTTLPK